MKLKCAYQLWCLRPLILNKNRIKIAIKQERVFPQHKDESMCVTKAFGRRSKTSNGSTQNKKVKQFKWNIRNDANAGKAVQNVNAF